MLATRFDESFDRLRRHGLTTAPAWFLLAVVFLLLRANPAGAEARDPAMVDDYAREYDVPEEVAAERLATQERGGPVVNGLDSLLGDSYAGVWFDNENGEF